MREKPILTIKRPEGGKEGILKVKPKGGRSVVLLFATQTEVRPTHFADAVRNFGFAKTVYWTRATLI